MGGVQHTHLVVRPAGLFVVLATLLCALPSPLLGECDQACITLCGQGDEVSCGKLGSLLIGKGIRKDRATLFDVDSTNAPTEAAELREILVNACKAKVGYACNLLGVAEEHTNPDRFHIDATGYFIKACRLGVADGCFNAGRQCLREPFSYEEAVGHFQAACDLGDDDGCMMVAAAYLDGTGVDVDAARAEKLYTELCDRSHATSCYVLGVILEERGESELAKKRLGRACELGVTEACK